MITASHDIFCDEQAGPDQRELEAEARFILSALEAAGPVTVEGRGTCRVRYRVEAKLRLVTDPPQDPPRRVYTRDITPHSLGFISPVAVPLGSNARLDLPASDGSVDTIACQVIRCREMIHGWFDGAVNFREEKYEGSKTTGRIEH